MRRRDILLSSTLLMVCCLGRSQNGSKPHLTHAAKTESVKLFSLSDLDSRLRDLAKRLQKTQATGKPQTNLTRGQVEQLYSALDKVRSIRGGYVTALNLYVNAVENQRSPSVLSARRTELVRNADAMQDELNQLQAVLAPLQLQIDLSWPNVKENQKNYLEQQSAAVLILHNETLIAGLSRSELRSIQQNVSSNGPRLQKVLDDLARVLRDNYGA